MKGQDARTPAISDDPEAGQPANLNGGLAPTQRSSLSRRAFLQGVSGATAALAAAGGQGHATVAGACSTIVKAWFDENFVIPDPVVASEDGLELLPYTGADAGQITLGGEMNKIAANIGIGRNHAAVHRRSDYADSLPLGEAVAISVLRDQRACYNEEFPGFTFTRFDGTRITV